VIAVSFDETLALEDQTFVGLLAADGCALYDEYVSGFDDVPTLLDSVSGPTRIAPPEFRFGERKDVRKVPREDATSVRSASACTLEGLYREYAELPAARPTASKRKKKRKKRKR
jgi:hypothetical protein